MSFTEDCGEGVCHLSLCVVCKGKLSVSCCVFNLENVQTKGVYELRVWVWPVAVDRCVGGSMSMKLRVRVFLLCLKFPFSACPANLVHPPSFLACSAHLPCCFACLPCIPALSAVTFLCVLPLPAWFLHVWLHPHLHITVRDIFGENTKGNLIVYLHCMRLSLCMM